MPLSSHFIVLLRQMISVQTLMSGFKWVYCLGTGQQGHHGSYGAVLTFHSSTLVYSPSSYPQNVEHQSFLEKALKHSMLI